MSPFFRDSSKPSHRSADEGADVSQVKHLERRLERLALACEALWEILQEFTDGMTNEKLERKMAEIDVRDGSPDRKIASTLLECKRCGRKNSSKRDFCLYCGSLLNKPHPFES